MTPNEVGGRLRLDARPSKRLLRNQARGVTPDIAISELVDNAIDVWRERETTRDLHVTVSFEFVGDRCSRLRIDDDGGGVEVERLTALVKAGIENPNPNAIGVWGQGLKTACIALAEDVRLVTRPRGGKAYQIDWSKEWWETDDWTLWGDPLNDDKVPPGSLSVILSSLKAPLRRDEVIGPPGTDTLLVRLSRIYAPLLSETMSAKLILVAVVGDQTIPVVADQFGDPGRWSEVFAFPPGYPPTIHERSFGRAGLTAKAIVGLLPEQSRDLSGVTMYGKGRLFVQALKEGAVGFGTRGAAMIPASHPTTWRLLVFVYFEGPSEEVPWTPGTKQGYAPSNPFNKEIRAFIADIAAPYAAFTKVAKRLDILPYSTKWNRLAEEERQQEIAMFTKNTANPREFVREAPHLAAKFEPQQPVEAATFVSTGAAVPPALNLSASRAIANGLNQRNADSRDSRSPAKLWTAQTLAARDVKRAAPATASSASAATPPELLKSSKADNDWGEHGLVTVRLPRAVLRMIETHSGLPAAAFIQQAAEARAARELDALAGIPGEPSQFRPILQLVRSRILEVLPDTTRIGVFGSVAKGTADRQSDIDVLVVHPDPLLAQRDANVAFQDFRHPAIHGARYRISTQVVDREGHDRLTKSDDPKTREMMGDMKWIHPLPIESNRGQ